MNLPLLLDIAIGLIFTYLILSLLASEIQELISTLLQWRAEHLKKSIQVLLSGGGGSQDTEQVKRLADRLYDHPLIKSLNQEAKGEFARFFRRINALIGDAYRKITGTEEMFDRKRSGPSYISPEVFASTMMETFKIPQIARLVSVSRLQVFSNEKFQELVNIGEEINLAAESRSIVEGQINELYEDWQKIVKEYGENVTTLDETIERLDRRTQTLIDRVRNYLSDSEDFRQAYLYRLQYWRDGVFAPQERDVLVRSLRPTLNEVVDLVREKQQLLEQVRTAFQDENSPTRKGFEEIIDRLPELPDSVRNSLNSLAQRIQEKQQNVREDLEGLQLAVEDWFDTSMTRASGVYKRNARGIAILIGLVVAIAANADSLYIVDSLSKSSVLRATISENAEQLIARETELTPATSDRIREQVNRDLDAVPLPIGWRSNVVAQQAEMQPLLGIPYARKLIGWIISGVAISMGASFWFDLLGKVMSIKNTGGKSRAPSLAAQPERRDRR